MNMCCFSECTL